MCYLLLHKPKEDFFARKFLKTFYSTFYDKLECKLIVK